MLINKPYGHMVRDNLTMWLEKLLLKQETLKNKKSFETQCKVVITNFSQVIRYFINTMTANIKMDLVRYQDMMVNKYGGKICESLTLRCDARYK